MILITGATGNVGAAVLTALAAEGAPVRALVRRNEDRARLPVAVDAVPDDLDRPATLRDAVGRRPRRRVQMTPA